MDHVMYLDKRSNFTYSHFMKPEHAAEEFLSNDCCLLWFNAYLGVVDYRIEVLMAYVRSRVSDERYTSLFYTNGANLRYTKYPPVFDSTILLTYDKVLDSFV